MRLPTGITMFAPGAPGYGDDDIFALKALFFIESWKLLGMRPSRIERSYYCFDLSKAKEYGSRRKKLSILVHKTHPYLCAIETPTDAQVTFEFVNVPTCIASLVPDRFYICAPDELVTPPVGEVLSELAEDELRQIEYWKPKRIGDVIFNWFD